MLLTYLSAAAPPRSPAETRIVLLKSPHSGSDGPLGGDVSGAAAPKDGAFTWAGGFATVHGRRRRGRRLLFPSHEERQNGE